SLLGHAVCINIYFEYVGMFLFPIPFLVDAEITDKQFGILTEHGFDFMLLERIKLPFNAFAIGIQRTVKTALWTGHLALYPLQRFVDHAFVLYDWLLLPSLGIQAYQLRIIIEHLFEMRNVPSF